MSNFILAVHLSPEGSLRLMVQSSLKETNTDRAPTVCFRGTLSQNPLAEVQGGPCGSHLLCALSLNHVQPFATPRLEPARFLSPWDFPGKNPGTGCHFLLQGLFLTQGSNPHLMHWQAGSLPLSHLENPGLILQVRKKMVEPGGHQANPQSRSARLPSLRFFPT